MLCATSNLRTGSAIAELNKTAPNKEDACAVSGGDSGIRHEVRVTVMRNMRNIGCDSSAGTKSEGRSWRVQRLVMGGFGPRFSEQYLSGRRREDAADECRGFLGCIVARTSEARLSIARVAPEVQELHFER